MANACPICDANDRQLDTLVWNHARRQGDHPAAVTAASERLGRDISDQQLRRHLAYHQPWQPPPLGYLNRRRALIAADRLPVRLQTALRIVWQQGAVTEWQLRELLWPASAYANANSAQAACYRDLARLVDHDWLYRAWLPRGRSRRRGAQRRREAVLLLGRNAAAWIEREHGVVPATISDAAKIDWDDVEARLEGVDALVAIASAAQHGAVVRKRELRAGVDLDNWFGPDDTQLWFRAAGLQSLDRRVRPAGLAVASLEAGGQELLLPFFYSLDGAHEPPARAAKRHLAWFGVVQTNASAERFPGLGRFVPPVLLITCDARRSAELAQEMAKQARGLRTLDPPALLMCDRVSLARAGWRGAVWRLAWDADAATPSRTLGEALIGGNKARLDSDPLIGGVALVPRRSGAVRVRAAAPGKMPTRATPSP